MTSMQSITDWMQNWVNVKCQVLPGKAVLSWWSSGPHTFPHIVCCTSHPQRYEPMGISHGAPDGKSDYGPANQTWTWTPFIPACRSCCFLPTESRGKGRISWISWFKSYVYLGKNVKTSAMSILFFTLFSSHLTNFTYSCYHIWCFSLVFSCVDVTCQLRLHLNFTWHIWMLLTFTQSDSANSGNSPLGKASNIVNLTLY